jgi:hypothetical protein
MAEHTPKVSRLEVITTGAHRWWTLADTSFGSWPRARGAKGKSRRRRGGAVYRRAICFTGARRCGAAAEGGFAAAVAGAGAVGICRAGCGWRGATGDQPWRGADRDASVDAAALARVVGVLAGR